MKKVLPAERTEVQLWAKSVIFLLCNMYLFVSKLYLAVGYWKITKAPSSSVKLTPLSKFLETHLTIAHEPLRSYEADTHRHFFPSYGTASWILFYKGRNISFNRRSQINVEISPILSILFSSFPCLTHFKHSFHQRIVVFCFQDATGLFLPYQIPLTTENKT